MKNQGEPNKEVNGEEGRKEARRDQRENPWTVKQNVEKLDKKKREKVSVSL
jgi:hypothetical protein